jgi:hypothetical protein
MPASAHREVAPKRICQRQCTCLDLQRSIPKTKTVSFENITLYIRLYVVQNFHELLVALRFVHVMYGSLLTSGPPLLRALRRASGSLAFTLKS